MNNSVLLDTSFLISLMDDSRSNHLKAKEFYKYFIENKYPMILSSIVTSEFSIKQKISDLPLNNLRQLPFNIPDSHHLSSLFETKFKGYSSGRVAVKDDYKIVSQCSFIGLPPCSHSFSKHTNKPNTKLGSQRFAVAL